MSLFKQLLTFQTRQLSHLSRSASSRQTPFSNNVLLLRAMHFNGISSDVASISRPLHICTGTAHNGHFSGNSLLTVNHTTCTRLYSTDDKEGDNGPNTNTELKGVVVHLPNPLMWLKNKWYSYCIRYAVDPSFNLNEFLAGAKQALSFLTRLIVQKDYDMLKSVASQEAIDTVMQLVLPWTQEQQDSIEVLVEDISLAAASISSFSKHGGSFHVSVDVLCIAVKRYKSRPLLIQMTVRFKREYSEVTSSDWTIADIREFSVKEMTAVKDGDQQPK